MATATQILNHRHHHHHLPKPKSSSSSRANLQVCFSFAAYAKKLIDHLKSLHIPILPGLTDSEFSHLESTLNCSFPPDLRSILQEGLPSGPNFPNWRSSSSSSSSSCSSSSSVLQTLLDLPALNLSTNIRRGFWAESWGARPDEGSELTAAVEKLLRDAPALVPIYTNCYIPASPTAAGNPVFYVDEEIVRVLSFDIAGFFQQLEINSIDSTTGTMRDVKTITLPAWAATAAREIEFWSTAAENGKRITAAETPGEGWWVQGELTECMEGVLWRLRDGGWREEEVREMMMMDGCDGSDGGERMAEEEEVRHVRMVSAGELLRAGWSREDVVYSLDLQDCGDRITAAEEEEEGESSAGATFEFRIPGGCGRRRRRSLRDFISLHSLEVEA